jgi:hypothetical protein
MHWDKPLSRPLMLKNGERLETLSDVRDLILERFISVTHSAALVYAGELLLEAAKMGEPTDIAAATDEIELVLMQKRLMQ